MISEKNKKSQFVGLVLSFIFFLIIFAIFGASFITDWISSSINIGGFGGFEAFLLSNFLLWVLVAAFIGIFYLAYLR